ncbi:MAG: hypothetical protein EBW16_05630, partial [Burkholderiaceae bacterium]|nr:hypothetical protein [Burkholderiaceae bacterium]
MQPKIGLLRDKLSQEFIDLCATDSSIPSKLREFIEIDPHFSMAKQALSNPNAIVKSLSEIKFDVLIDQPGKIVCLGLNYADHAK